MSSYFLLNDGTSKILLNDGTSKLLLNPAAPSYAGPVWQNGGTIGVDGNTPIAVPYPSSISAGDFLLMFILANGSTDTFTTPSGWTYIAGPVTSSTKLAAYAFYKIATGSESGSLSVTWTAIAKAYGFIQRFTGADSVESVVTNTGTGTTMSDAGVTSSDVNRLAIQLSACGQVNQNFGTYTGQTGGTWVERAEIDDGTGTDSASWQLQTADLAAAGTIDGGSVTVTSCSWGVIGMALYQTPPPAVGYPYIGGGYYPN